MVGATFLSSSCLQSFASRQIVRTSHFLLLAWTPRPQLWHALALKTFPLLLLASCHSKAADGGACVQSPFPVVHPSYSATFCRCSRGGVLTLGCAERLPRLACPSCVSAAARRRSPQSGAAADPPRAMGACPAGRPRPRPARWRPRAAHVTVVPAPPPWGRAEGAARSGVFSAGPGRARMLSPGRTTWVVVSGNSGRSCGSLLLSRK